MTNDFHLTESAADELLQTYRSNRDAADAAGRHLEAATWGEAARLLSDAQLEGFKARGDAESKRRESKHARWIGKHAKPASAYRPTGFDNQIIHERGTAKP